MPQQLLSIQDAFSFENWSKLAGRLVARGPADAASHRFSVLDCFDQSIRQSGRLLIEYDAQLVLIDKTGRLWRQSAQRSGNFVHDLGKGPVRARLSDLSPLRCLLDVGQGQIEENQLRLVDDEEKTHVRVETMQFHTGDRYVTLLAIDAVRGYGKSQDRVVQGLTDAGAQLAQPCAVTAALFPKLVPYVAKPKLVFADETLSFSAARQIIAAYLDVARQNEAGAIADFDTEFLHDYRVALRKIRSVLSLFQGVFGDAVTAELKQRFFDLMAPTGPLRDLDVYLLERDYYFDLLPQSLHEGLELMFATFEADRSAVLAQVTKRLKSVAYNREMADLQGMFDGTGALVQGPLGAQNVRDYACKLIWKRYRKACKTAAKIDDTTPDEEVHELRITCKKLRYLMEFFAPQFPAADIKAILKPLKRLQDNLGLFNDYSVQQDTLQALVNSDRLKGRKAVLAAQSIGALISVLHQRQLSERARVVSSFQSFDSMETRQRFRTLFHSKGAHQ